MFTRVFLMPKIGRAISLLAEGRYNSILGSASNPDCISDGCTPAQMAQFDHWEWSVTNAAVLPTVNLPRLFDQARISKLMPSLLIAQLPMYDWPEVHEANDRLWQIVASECKNRSISAPEPT